MLQGKKPDTKRIPSSATRVFEPDLARSSFMRRLGAAFIDHLIIWTIAFIVWIIAYPRGNLYETRNAGILFAGVLAALLVYYWSFTALKGQTPGKRLCKIRVIDTRGRRPSWGRALWRESIARITMLISLFIEGIFLIVSNMSAYTLSYTVQNTYPEKGYRKSIDREPVNVLGFFDRFSGTYVIRVGQERKS
jgi:uncharacterized RDD family membrane protein YckC